MLDMVIAPPPGKTLEPAMSIPVGFGTTVYPAIVKVFEAGGGLSNAVSSSLLLALLSDPC